MVSRARGDEIIGGVRATTTARFGVGRTPSTWSSMRACFASQAPGAGPMSAAVHGMHAC